MIIGAKLTRNEFQSKIIIGAKLTRNEFQSKIIIGVKLTRNRFQSKIIIGAKLTRNGFQRLISPLTFIQKYLKTELPQYNIKGLKTTNNTLNTK